MDEHSTPAPADADPAINCVICSYNLEGVHPKAPCPQCRVRASCSVPGRTLDASSLSYIRKLRCGWFFVAAGLVLQLVLLVALIVIEDVIELPEEEWSLALSIAFLIAGAGTVVASLAGPWLLSAPDPAMANPEDGAVLRTWVRILTVLFGITFLVAVVYPMLITLPEPEDDLVAIGFAIIALELLSRLFLLAQHILLLALLAWLSTRLPTLKGYRRSRRAAWWLATSVALLIAGLVVPTAFLFTFDAFALFEALLFVMMALGIVCLLVSLVYYIGALRSIWLALNPIHRAKLAEANAA